MRRLVNTLRGMSKWRLFGLLVLATVALSALTSLITYVTVLDRSRATPLRIALIAPMSGEDRQIGLSMQAGATQWTASLTRRGGPAGHPIELLVFDETTDPDAARKAVADPSVIGIIGPFGEAATARARPVLEAASLPALTLGSASDSPGPRVALFEMAPKPLQEVRFLANYVRNVLGERLVSIILPTDAGSETLADGFDQVLQRFGTRVVYRWPAPTDSPATQDAALKAAAADISDRKVAGTILVLGPQAFAARAIAALRGAEVPNRIIGTSTLATNAFRSSFQAAWAGHGAGDAAMNGTVVTLPVLFDTAGIAAQAFRDNVTAATGTAPDWPAVLSYDAASVLGTALSAEIGALNSDPATLRERLRLQIASYNNPDRALPGLAGPLFFEAGAGTSLPELIGTFDGTELVSALTQLSPIREQGVPNFLDELTSGRALYVNDRFMYKTNVVYAGVQLEKVLDLNPDTNIADIECLIWFRWRGVLDPQNIVFPNAVTPIQLTTPERESKTGDFSYQSYRVRGKFYMNYSGISHRYGTQAVEVKFRHRVLGRNNLMYVTDVLGLGLTTPKTTGGGASDWLHKLFGTTLDTSPLVQRMSDARVLAGAPGWLVERAWLSQDLGQATSNGDPVFVGFGKPAPVFSTIGLGMVAKPDTLDLAGMVPHNWLVYTAISAFSLTLLAYMLDRRDRGHFWRMQTLVLRVVGWPVLLSAVSALALDYAQENLTPSGALLLSQLFGILWWLVPARLLQICIERFVWVPLELSTGRRIPTVFRMMVGTLIFVLAGFGIVAFVLGKTITSLLATSGVLTLIVGLALQSNLKDIISGIMLNLERPFVIGDYLMLNKSPVRVVDVSWRTTRLETTVGSIIALPNGKMSDSEIENMTKQAKFKVVSLVALDPAYSPDRVVAALRHAAESVPVPVTIKEIGLVKIEKVGANYVATYSQEMEARDYTSSKRLKEIAMQYIWHALTEAGIDWAMPGDAAPVVEPVEKPATPRAVNA